jgi:hypothetical protein
MAATGTKATSPSVEAVINALRQHDGATAAQLAEAAGIGRSTASKTLSSLEAEGRVTRQRDTSKGGKPTPDRWTLTLAAADEVDHAAPEQPSAAVAEPAAELASTTASEGQQSGEESASPTPVPDIEGGTATGAATDAERPEGGRASGPRLRPGALRTLVHDWLAQRPGQEFTPTNIGKELGRSAGAVGNALASMTDQGEVIQTSQKPRRYAIAEGSDQAGATR